MPLPRHFTLETLVDFPDDALSCDFAVTREHLDSLMRMLAEYGVGRVIWGYYGDGHGGWMAPGGIDALVRAGVVGDDQNYYGSMLRTYRELGNPLREGCAAAHRHGLEVYAYFKPYETGVAMAFPAGSPEALEWGRLGHVGGFLSWLDPFVAEHPELRIKRRTDDLWPGYDTVPIATIKLTKKDASPTRVTKDRLSLWASQRNYGYERLSADFGFAEAVEPSPREVRDVYGNLVTRRGDAVRVLTLSALNLAAPFVALATDFSEGEPDFDNAWHRLAVAYDAQGRELPCVVATGTAIWFPELERFPERGLAFETGRGPEGDRAGSAEARA